MSPKHKADDLYWSYYHQIEHTLSDEYASHTKFVVKECALLAVDEIIRTLNHDIRDLDVRGSVLLDLIRYWRDVRNQIEEI